MLNLSISLFERYGLALLLLFCLGFFSPDLSEKLMLMDTNISENLESLSGSKLEKQLFWLLIFALSLASVFLKRSINKSQFKQILAIQLFGILMLISAIWSEYPLLTIKRSILQLIICFSVSVAFFNALNKKRLKKQILITVVGFIGIVFLAIALGVGFTHDNMLIGHAVQKNHLGQGLIVLLILYFVFFKIEGVRFRVQDKLIYLLLIILLVLTISKTSMALLVLFFVMYKFTNKHLSSFALTSMLLILFSVFVFIPALSNLSDGLYNITVYLDPDSITGRGIIWETLYYDLYYFDKFILGYGYGAYFGIGSIPYFFDVKWSFLQFINSSHNSYLDFFLQLGALGCVPLLVIFLYVLKGNNLHVIYCARIIAFAYGFTESAIIKDQTIMWIFLIILLTINTSTLRERAS